MVSHGPVVHRGSGPDKKKNGEIKENEAVEKFISEFRDFPTETEYEAIYRDSKGEPFSDPPPQPVAQLFRAHVCIPVSWCTQ